MINLEIKRMKIKPTSDCLQSKQRTSNVWFVNSLSLSSPAPMLYKKGYIIFLCEMFCFSGHKRHCDIQDKKTLYVKISPYIKKSHFKVRISILLLKLSNLVRWRLQWERNPPLAITEHFVFFCTRYISLCPTNTYLPH